jgi:molecular chaperone GrpE
MDPENQDGTNDEQKKPGEAAETDEAGTLKGTPPQESAGAESRLVHEPPKAERHEHDESRSLKSRLRKKEHELKDLKRDLADFKDKYLRMAAEMDNQRKRLDREKSDYFQFALADLLREMLPVYDNFERAVQSLAAAENGAALEGVGLIARQFMDVLRKRGVAEVEAEGRPFDPGVHQAVLSVESADVREAVVGEVYQKGYKLNDRLLRPALVKVIIPVKS